MLVSPRIATTVAVLLAVLWSVCLTGQGFCTDESMPRVSMGHDAIERLSAEGCNWDFVQRHVDTLQFQTNALAYLAPEERIAALAPVLQRNGIKVSIEGAYFDWEPLIQDFTADPNPKGISERMRGGVFVGVGAETARNEIRKAEILIRNGLPPDLILLDGPIRRLIDPNEEETSTRADTGLSLDEAVVEIVAYIRTWREAFPDIQFVAITNFPNWSWKHWPAYRPDKKGHGDYHPAIQAVLAGARKAGIPFAGVRADTPYEFAIGTALIPDNVWDPAPVDWLARLLDLEAFVHSEGLEFQVTMNSSKGGQVSPRSFYIETLRWLETYRVAGGAAEFYMVHTWYPHPREVGPETKPYTLTNLTMAVIKDFQGERGRALAEELARPRPKIAESFEDVGPPSTAGGNAHPDSIGAGIWSYWLATGANSPVDLGPGGADYAPMVWNGKSGEYHGYMAGPDREYPSILSDHVGRTQMVPHVGHDPVLRWTSTVEGEVHISGTWWLSPPGGNVHLAIFADGKPLFEQRDYTSTHNPGVPFDLRVSVRSGTSIEWWTDANGDPSYDGPRLRALVDLAPK